MRLKRWIVSTSLLVSGMTGLTAQGAAPKTWELRDGQWQPTAESPTTAAAVRRSDPTLDEAEDLLVRGRVGEAHKLLIRWEKQNKNSPNRDRALFLIAETYDRRDDRIRAFYQLEELLDLYEGSPYFQRALQKQYDIADSYLSGKKDLLFGMRILSRVDQAVEMLFRVQQRAPGSAIAERSLLRTADYYYADSQFDLAEDAYAYYAERYPRAAILPQVRLRRAFATLAQFNGLKFDETPLTNARAQFVQLSADYPELARQENLKDIIERIDETFAQKEWVRADFYQRTNQPRATGYTLERLLKTYPTSPLAEQARTRVEGLPEFVMKPVPLPTTRPFEPEGP